MNLDDTQLADYASKGARSLEDLRLRLHGSVTQERAARAEVRRLGRELDLTRRLLRFGAQPARTGPRAFQPNELLRVPRLKATDLSEGIRFSLDACEDCGEWIAITGWAFRACTDWDCKAASVALRLRVDGAILGAKAGKVLRPDVAAFYAQQPALTNAGARHLAHAGFACEVNAESLPPNATIEVGLRLQCAGLMAEIDTGTKFVVSRIRELR